MDFRRLLTEFEVLTEIELINRENEYCVIDSETTGLNYFTDSITDIVFSGSHSNSVYICDFTFIRLFKELIRPIIAHNFKFDFRMFLRNGVDLRSCGLFADTMLLDHLLNENLEHGLDSIIQRRYNDSYKEVFWNKYKTYEEATAEDKLNYACKDVYYTKKVFNDTLHDLQLQDIPRFLIEHVHSLALVLYNMEAEGIKLDLHYLETIGKELSAKISEFRQKMRLTVDIEATMLELDLYEVELEKRKTSKGKLGVKKPKFNFDSNLQLSNLFYNKLNLPIRLNKAKNRTVDDGALASLEQDHPIVPLVREYRGYQKVYTSFIEGTLEKMHEGRIHPSFNVNGTVTGRISSSGPNMQQLPTEGGIRGIYIPDLGYKFLSCDYNQLEVTIAAHYSRDANLLKIVYEGASQHDITAAGLGIPRQVAKTINFALQYGAGATKIQKILGCSLLEAEKTLTRYWDTYSGLRDFIKSCNKTIEEGKPLINPFGRNRRFPTKEQIIKDNPGGWKNKITGKWVNSWEPKWNGILRQGANSLIQGTGADLTSYSVYTIDEKLRQDGFGYVLFSVHDEVLCQIKDNYTPQATEIITNTMIGAGKLINLTVPLTVSIGKPMNRWVKS